MPKNPRNEKVMNRKSLTILTAVACLVIANYPAMAQELTPAQTQFSWDEWGVSIKGLSVTDRVPKTFGPETADGDSIFVVLNLVVQNNSHSGKAFIPQNDLKLVIGENAFDAEDLDGTLDYARNIEPTLIRSRNCYFEVPKTLLKDLFTLRFSTFWVQDVNVPVTVAEAKTPAPAPVVAATPTPAATPDASSVVTDRTAKHFEQVYDAEAKALRVENRKSVRADQLRAEYTLADNELNAAWAALTPKQRARYRNDERAWIKYRDGLPTLEARIAEIQERTSFLQSIAGS